jgi:RNA polymerase sigma factor (sigma-70 family)
VTPRTDGPRGAPSADAVEDLLRELAPQVLAALARRNGDFAACEDAVQEALLAAAQQWPGSGVPQRPRAWLTTVANRRLTDEVRSASARRRREDDDAASRPADEDVAPGPERSDPEGGADDELTLLFLCCHPALTPSSQMALTLRAVGGLTTAEIAAAFLVPESTMGQRISRAKQRIAEAGARFEAPSPTEWETRLAVVRHVLYLVFNEGYSSTGGHDLQRRELAAEAIRLVRRLRLLAPDDAEVAGLLALMLLTDARQAARVAADGSLVPLAEQDRALWDRELIAEGVALVMAVLPEGRIGPFQLQAAIAAVHDEAPTVEETDWMEIAGLYRLLGRIDPSPVVTLNHAVAVGMVEGPAAGLAMVDGLTADGKLHGHHRVHVVRAHLLERAGDLDGARAELREAIRRTTSTPEQRHLQRRLSELDR